MAAQALIGAEQLREVRLYGELAKRFGRRYRLAVSTPREAAQALAAVVPGFEAYMVEHSEPGFHVFVGGLGRDEVTVDTLEAPVGRGEPICIVPAVAGAKKGWASVILGLVIMYFAPYAAGYAWGAGASVGVSVGIGTVGTYIGQALVLGGAVQLLSPQPSAVGSEARPEGVSSFAFDGAVNTTQQGLPVPLTFGRVMMGCAIISGGVSSDELPIEPVSAPMPAQPLPPEEPRNPIDDGSDWQRGD